MADAQTSKKENEHGTCKAQTHAYPHTYSHTDKHSGQRVSREAEEGRVMLDAVLALAVVCAGLSALMGNRTAMALLASTAFTFSLTLAGAPFSAPAWIAVDLFVIAVILLPWPHIPTADRFVLALFAPSWALYFVDSAAGYAASVVVCSAQMALTLPPRRLLKRAKEAARRLDPFDGFDLRVRHGDAG